VSLTELWTVGPADDDQSTNKGVPLLNRFVAGFLARKRRFDPGPVHVRFVVKNEALREGFLQVLLFPPSLSLNQCSIIIFVLILLLSEGQAGGRVEIFKQSNAHCKHSPFTVSVFKGAIKNLNSIKERGIYLLTKQLLASQWSWWCIEWVNVCKFSYESFGL
jgi:hypothetical protein